MPESLFNLFPQRTVTKYYIGPRNAWDHVRIGLFDTIEEAKEHCDESGWDHSLIHSQEVMQFKNDLGWQDFA